MLPEVQKLIKEGKIDQAIELAEREYSKSKDDKLYNLYGIALFKKGEFEKASEVFGELYKKYPENLNLFLNYSRSLMEAGKLEDAERVLREGAMLFADSEKVFELLDECQRRKEERRKYEKEKEERKKKDKDEKEKKEEVPEEELKAVETKVEIEEEKEKFEQQKEIAEDIEIVPEIEGPEEIEQLEEKVEELKREIEESIGAKTGKEEEEKEKKIEKEREKEEDEKIELKKLEEKEGMLRRGRILEISLKGESEIVLRETFIIFISGSYKIFPLKKIEEQKIKNEFFGGKNHKFLKIRGIECEIMLSTEYISAFEVNEEYEKAIVLEPFLIGFEPSFKYNSTKIKKLFNLVELSGQGKVIIHTAKSKVFIKSINEETRVSATNFIGTIGPVKLNFLQDSFEISGKGKVILRI
ncbi:MAG: tetratricopeptide repeat protein [Candidatus Calescibacterium sp.]|jgi:tetratricopeptide (TPR) repeat protein